MPALANRFQGEAKDQATEGARPWSRRSGCERHGARDSDRLSAQSWDQDVVAGAAVEQVHATVPLQHVVTGAANERVVGRTTDQEVVAVTAVRRELDGASRPA